MNLNYFIVKNFNIYPLPTKYNILLDYIFSGKLNFIVRSISEKSLLFNFKELIEIILSESIEKDLIILLYDLLNINENINNNDNNVPFILSIMSELYIGFTLEDSSNTSMSNMENEIMNIYSEDKIQLDNIHSNITTTTINKEINKNVIFKYDFQFIFKRYVPTIIKGIHKHIIDNYYLSEIYKHFMIISNERLDYKYLDTHYLESLDYSKLLEVINKLLEDKIFVKDIDSYYDYLKERVKLHYSILKYSK